MTMGDSTFISTGPIHPSSQRRAPSAMDVAPLGSQPAASAMITAAAAPMANAWPSTGRSAAEPPRGQGRGAPTRINAAAAPMPTRPKKNTGPLVSPTATQPASSALARRGSRSPSRKRTTPAAPRATATSAALAPPASREVATRVGEIASSKDVSKAPSTPRRRRMSQGGTTISAPTSAGTARAAVSPAPPNWKINQVND
jgi:hypothetical protein